MRRGRWSTQWPLHQMTRLACVLFLLATSMGQGPIPLSLSDGAYLLIAQRVTANQTNFYVYQDADAGLNHGAPSGFFGEFDKIRLEAACVDDPNSPTGCSPDANRLDRVHGTVLRVSFDALGTFAGVNIEEPENHGVNPRGSGYDMRGATRLLFDARSPSGLKAQFGVGGCTSNLITLPASQTEYTPVTIPLNTLRCQPDLSNVHTLFTVVVDGTNAPNGGTVLLDNIRVEPVPTRQQSLLGLPVSTQTFGLVPQQSAAQGRVPLPSDQVLRNLATTYESGLAAIALFARGTEQDLHAARLLADTLAYALQHDNQGILLPTAPGAAGLHDGYASGDIALLNGQGAGAGQAGEVRLAGFSAGRQLCNPTGFCTLLDGATGGNNAFAALALASAYRRTGAARYLDAARMIGRWIITNLADTTGTGYGGYYLGYANGSSPKEKFKSKSTENNAALFAALTLLAAVDDQPNDWATHAEVAGDFVLEMFDNATGGFRAGTVPAGTQPGPGVSPDGPRRGNELINTFDFLDANVFAVLALAATQRYRQRLDWRRPVQYVRDKFAQTIAAQGQTFSGFNIVARPAAGPNGVAWEFTGKAVTAFRFVDRLYQEVRFKEAADLYLGQLRQAQRAAPFADGQGLVASTLQNGEQLSPLEQCLSTPFQCIPQRVGLAATTWAIFAAQEINPLDASALNAPAVVTVSAASYSRDGLAKEAIAASFGPNLALTTEVATTIPLPTTLADTQVLVRDSAQSERLAPLFFVSPGQINYQFPPGMETGTAQVTVVNGGRTVAVETALVARVAPGLFTVDGSGRGLAAGVALRFKPDNSYTVEPLVRFDPTQNRFVAVPLDLGPATDRVFLALFGTGLRFRSSTAALSATMGGVGAPVLDAVAQPEFVGLDQVNIGVPRSLAGRGEVDIALIADAKVANLVRVHIK